MQELFLLIKERFDKVRTLCQAITMPDALSKFKEEQKIRCEKQTWIFSMLRSKKNLLPHQKISYLKHSHAIMQVIQPNFLYEFRSLEMEEDFLNEFVCIFTAFFAQYERTFNFKIKIRNMLRPTNQNIVTDLVKYLLDFSRDYSQHLYFWQLKNEKKLQMEAQSTVSKRNGLSKIKQQGSFFSKQIEQSCKNSKNAPQTTQIRKKEPEISIELSTNKQKQFNRIYGVLEIQSQSAFIVAQKIKMNPQTLKQKINELYREQKWRNFQVKKSISDYWNYCFPNNPNPYKQFILKDSNNVFPYNITLSIQKNGYSSLNVSTQQRIFPSKEGRFFSPAKEAPRTSSLSEGCHNSNHLKTHQINPEVVLNSLKVLKVSENFLPPLIETSCKLPENPFSKESLQYQKNERISSCVFYRQSMEIFQQKRLTSQRKNVVLIENPPRMIGLEQRRIQSKRLSEMKRNLVVEQRVKQNQKPKNNSQQKIVEWLDKINMMKQLQRKKIMGLS